MNLQKGQRISLSSEANEVTKLTCGLGWTVDEDGDQMDVSVFMLGLDGKIPNDKYLVFYNNHQSFDSSLKYSEDNQVIKSDEKIYIDVDLTEINSLIQEIVFVVSIHQAQAKQQNFGQIKNVFIRIYRQDTKECLVDYNLEETLSEETALELGLVYRKNSEWRFKAIGEGYNEGFERVINRYCPNNQLILDRTKVAEKKKKAHIEVSEKCIDIKQKSDINLLKSKVEIVLEKKNISKDVRARVALVLDISGSMANQYKSGAVQAFLERIVPVASKLDNDGELDVWFFASTFKRTTSVHENNVDGYVSKECGENKRSLLFFEFPSLALELGGGNNESLVIGDVIKKYTQEEPSRLPTFVVFLSDGGVTDHKGIQKAVINAAKYPIFWQFVGLAGSNYGILEELDSMTGRVVDNANFFHVDDLAQITDEQLYDRLLNEFPSWMREARKKGILPVSIQPSANS